MLKPKPHARDNILTPEETEKLKKACINEEERLIIYGLLYTGMRISEFIHIKKNWIDGKFISVPLMQKCKCYECMSKEIYQKIRDKKTKEIIGNKLIKPKGHWRVKTESARRLILILPEFKEILERYLKEHSSIMERVPNRVYAWGIIKRISRRVKINHKIFPHSLRATFATILASKGFGEIELRNMMGWKKIATAEEYIKFDKTRIEKMFEEKW